VPCARLGWPSRQLLSARKSTVSYRIVSPHSYFYTLSHRFLIACAVRCVGPRITRCCRACKGPQTTSIRSNGLQSRKLGVVSQTERGHSH